MSMTAGLESPRPQIKRPWMKLLGGLRRSCTKWRSTTVLKLATPYAVRPQLKEALEMRGAGPPLGSKRRADRNARVLQLTRLASMAPRLREQMTRTDVEKPMLFRLSMVLPAIMQEQAMREAADKSMQPTLSMVKPTSMATEAVGKTIQLTATMVRPTSMATKVVGIR